MYKLVFGGQFLQSAKRLAREMKPRLKVSLDILFENPFHPTLRTKSLSGKLAGYHSFRVGREYRVIFKFISDNVIYLLRMGNRRDIYK